MDKHTRRWNLQQGGLFPARRRANLPPLHSSLLDSSLWGIWNVSRILGMDRRRWWRTRRRWWGLRLLVWRNNKINRRHAKLVLTLCYPVAKFLLLSGCSSLDFLLLHDIFIFSSLFFPSFLTCQEITFEKLVSTLLTIFFIFSLLVMCMHLAEVDAMLTLFHLIAPFIACMLIAEKNRRWSIFPTDFSP